MQGAKSIIRVSSEKLLGGGGLQEEGSGRSKNLKASSLKVPMVAATQRKAFQRYPVRQDARKILDRTFSVLEEGLRDARNERKRCRLARGSGPEVVRNASGDGDRPSLAREGDSEVDRRKREKLQQPRRLQEDEELYEEKERNQKVISKFLNCPFFDGSGRIDPSSTNPTPTSRRENFRHLTSVCGNSAGTAKSSVPLQGTAKDRCRFKAPQKFGAISEHRKDRRRFEALQKSVPLRGTRKLGAASRRFRVGAASRHGGKEWLIKNPPFSAVPPLCHDELC